MQATKRSGLCQVHWNLATPALYEYILQRSEARLARGGALVASTGSRTGRSPLDRFIVKEPSTASDIWWGEVNRPIGKDVEMQVSERPLGAFSRQLFLGDTLDTDRIDAQYDSGVLTLRIPIAERAKPRKIAINSRDEAPKQIDA